MRGYWWRSTRVDGCSPAAIEVAARHGWSERRGWGKETRAWEGEEEERVPTRVGVVGFLGDGPSAKTSRCDHTGSLKSAPQRRQLPKNIRTRIVKELRLSESFHEFVPHLLHYLRGLVDFLWPLHKTAAKLKKKT